MEASEAYRPRIIVSGGRPGPGMISRSVENMVELLTNMGADVELVLDHEGRNAAEDLARVNGIVVMGNNLDVPPWMYDETQNPHTKPTDNNARLAYEWDAIELCVERNIPYTGICYGSQLLNVVMGGKLIQHIPDEVGSGGVSHWNVEQLSMGVQALSIVPGTALGGLFEQSNLESSTVFVASTGEGEMIADVNTGHHQSSDPMNLGRGLRVAAWSVSDRVVEATEMTGKPIRGIQWHPEWMPNHPLTGAIIRDIVDRSAYYAQTQLPQRDAILGEVAGTLRRYVDRMDPAIAS